MNRAELKNIAKDAVQFSGSHKGIDHSVITWLNWDGRQYWSAYMAVKYDARLDKETSGENEYLAQIKFHSGCTFRERDGDYLILGCDYNHLWDDDIKYEPSRVESDIIEAVESYLKLKL